MASYILIGPMGVGKTTIGRALAQRLALDFIDSDHIIEERQGKSISEIFIEDGEEAFRRLERDVVLAVIDKPGVVALGGGACLSAQAQEAIAASGAEVIFLDISLAEVSKRVGFDKARPLLAINPRSKWQELMAARRPLYEKLATLQIMVDGKSKSEIVDEILDQRKVS